MSKLQATKFKQVGREHYLSSASFKVIISDCAVCGCFFDVTVAIPHNDAAVYCKPDQMIRKNTKNMLKTNPYSLEEPFLYEITRLPSSFTCSTAPLLPCVMTFCDIVAEEPEEEDRNAGVDAAS